MESIYLKFSDYLDNSKPTSLGIYFSLLLHLSILLFAIGLPDFFKPKEISVPIIIPIEILNVRKEELRSVHPLYPLEKFLTQQYLLRIYEVCMMEGG